MSRSREDRTGDHRTDADGPTLSPFPAVAAFLLAWTVGVVDSTTYLRYGVFTSNQAGNLVIAATEIFPNPGGVTLPLLSLAGAIVGAAVGNLIALRYPATDLRRAVHPLTLATLLLIVTVGLDLGNVPAPVIIPVVAAAFGMLAVALMRTPAVGRWLTANTGQLLAAVIGVTEWRRDGWRGLPQAARAGVLIITGFLLGSFAVGTGLLAQHAIVIGLGPALVALALGFRALRHQPPPDGGH